MWTYDLDGLAWAARLDARAFMVLVLAAALAVGVVHRVTTRQRSAFGRSR